MMHRPERHPLLDRLAARLLAKAERSTAAGPVRLRLDARELPELHGALDADAAGRIELLLRDLAASGWVELRLSRARDFAGFADRAPQLRLLDFEALADWLQYPRASERWQRQWLEHLRGVSPLLAEPAAQQALLDYLSRNPLRALADLDFEMATASLRALQHLCAGGQSMALREASSRCFQGRSKLLDRREELLRLLGAAPDQFWELPLQLLIDLPPRLERVLFIENLLSFERMAAQREADWAHSLLVYAAGFKGSARRLRTRAGCSLYLRASGLAGLSAAEAAAGLAAVQACLFEEEGGESAALPVEFFGDLDFAGMQILARLRESFPRAQAWQPGYARLLRHAQAGLAHAPASAGKDGQQDPGSTGCAYADTRLLPALREQGRFVDQEVFGVPGD